MSLLTELSQLRESDTTQHTRELNYRGVCYQAYPRWYDLLHGEEGAFMYAGRIYTGPAHKPTEEDVETHPILRVQPVNLIDGGGHHQRQRILWKTGGKLTVENGLRIADNQLLLLASPRYTGATHWQDARIMDESEMDPPLLSTVVKRVTTAGTLLVARFFPLQIIRPQS